MATDEDELLPEILPERANVRYGLSANARRLGAWRRLKALRALYESAGLPEAERNPNPLFALAAYKVARDFGVVIPEWVFRYFDLLAMNTALAGRNGLSKSGKDKVGPALVRAFGFAPGGVQRQYRQFLGEAGVLADSHSDREGPSPVNAFKARDLSERDIEIVDFVRITAARNNPDGARSAAMKYFKVSKATVDRALRRYQTAPTPVIRISDAIRLCERSGMSRRDAIDAVAAERGFHPQTIRDALRRRITTAAR